MTRVVISKDGDYRGGAVHLDRTHVVAAAHSLPSAQLGASCHVERRDGKHPATVVDVDGPRDAVLLRVSDPDCAANHAPARAAVHERRPWAAPYGPGGAMLTGRVDSVRREVALTTGPPVDCIQLSVRQLLGSYAGYSGGPVTQPNADGPVVGMIVEQIMDRASANPDRASNVLYAVPQEDLWERFRPHMLPEGLKPAGRSNALRHAGLAGGAWSLGRALHQAAAGIAAPPAVRALNLRRRAPKTQP